MFKLSLWAVTLAGLAPVCILAANVVYVNVGNYLSSRNATETQFSSQTSLKTFTVADTPVSNRLWPAALALAGSALVAAGLLSMLQKTSAPHAGHLKDVPIIIASLAEHERNAGPDIIGISVGDEGPYFILHGGDEDVMVSFPYQELPKNQFAEIRNIACKWNGSVVEHEVYPEGGGIQIYTFDKAPSASDFCMDVLRDEFRVQENTKILFTLN